jgi:hypothetical protein
MDWHVSELRVEPVGDGIGSAATDEAARGSVPRAVSDAHADPEVQVLMAADGVVRASLVALSRRMAGQFALRARAKRWVREW